MGLLTSKEACQLLGVEEVTLILWRHKKKGPDYLKIGGNVRYRLKDIENYLDNCAVKLNSK